MDAMQQEVEIEARIDPGLPAVLAETSQLQIGDHLCPSLIRKNQVDKADEPPGEIGQIWWDDPHIYMRPKRYPCIPRGSTRMPAPCRYVFARIHLGGPAAQSSE